VKREDWLKVGKGAGIAVSGALLSYTSTQVVPQLDEAGNFNAMLLSAAFSVLVNLGRKWLAKQTV
jgi:hypothetical protein